MRSDEGPIAYRALRRLEAHNQHFGANAWMDVWTEADEAGGFRYQVVAEGGSGYIRRRVFLAALEGEQKMWREGEPTRAHFNHTNYSFKDNGQVDGGLASLAISPKRKDVLLVDGWLFVKQEDGDLVRIEDNCRRERRSGRAESRITSAATTGGLAMRTCRENRVGPEVAQVASRPGPLDVSHDL
jgi:hypothetical protein